jgi:hypothetical protein
MKESTNALSTDKSMRRASNPFRVRLERMARGDVIYYGFQARLQNVFPNVGKSLVYLEDLTCCASL